jgi:hypothetical protein
MQMAAGRFHAGRCSPQFEAAKNRFRRTMERDKRIDLTSLLGSGRPTSF